MRRARQSAQKEINDLICDSVRRVRDSSRDEVTEMARGQTKLAEDSAQEVMNALLKELLLQQSMNQATAKS
jgi:phytoene dehydrogenase-like protein